MLKTSGVLITGATGFLGSSLLDSLQNTTMSVKGSVRQQSSDKSLINVGELSDKTDWSSALKGVDVVIHCAGMAHSNIRDYEAFYQVNVLATQKLLEQCVSNGVKQFIFISSIGVNGNITTDKHFSFNDKPNPLNAYAKSKAMAEKQIIDYLADKDMCYTIIRPPLIYGKNAPGNFGTLMKIVDKNIPLPLAGVGNLRSMVGLRNLMSLIECCISNEAAYNQVFLVSDNNDISTDDLLKTMGRLSGKSMLLFPFPKIFIQWGAKLMKKETVYQGLFESLQIDISETNKLGWQPPYTVEQELAQCFNEEN